MSCAGLKPPWSLDINDPTTFSSLSSALSQAFSGTLAGNEASVYCAANPNICLGICPNADVAGVGVRVAFYINAILTALLVALSPDESPSAAWTSTLLTISMVIPAVIQKKQGALTLYHATLVLNFVTFSSISTLAVAPLCTVWRQIDNKNHPRHINQTKPPTNQHIPLPVLTPGPRPLSHPNQPEPVKTTEPQRHRARIILSVALIAQVSLQWAWATYMFTSPYYAQTACNPITIVVLFGVSLKASDINRDHFGLWASWLLFSIGVTLIFGVLLVLSSTSGANPDRVPRKKLRDQKTSWLTRSARKWDPNGNKRRTIIFVVAAFICLMLMVVSEVQAQENCVFGENDTWGFGQIAALLFALAPLWSILESEKVHQYYNDFSAFLTRKRTPSQAVAGANPTTPANPQRGRRRSGSQDALLSSNGQPASPPISSDYSPRITPQHSPSPSDSGSPSRPLLTHASRSSLVHGRSSTQLSALDDGSGGEEDDHWDPGMLTTHPPRIASDSSLRSRLPLVPSVNVIPPSTANSRAPSLTRGVGEPDSPLSPWFGSLINFNRSI